MMLLIVFLHLVVSLQESRGQVNDQDLTRFSCELYYNTSKLDVFHDRVAALAQVQPGEEVPHYYSVVYSGEPSVFGAEGEECNAKSDVTWCLHIWHPVTIIRVCLNSTWNSSTELAAQYNLIDNLEYQSSCYNQEYAQAYACLRIKNGRRYFSDSIITSQGSCLTHGTTFYSIYYASLDTTVYTSAPTMPVHYAYYGDSIVLTCEFVSQTIVHFSSWRNTTGDQFDFVIEEDFTCNSTVVDCYNDSRPEALAAKTKRVRQYRLVELLDCFGGEKVHVYLVIDDLRIEDGGNYTCFALDTNNKEANNQIQVIPVPPVMQPLNVSLSPDTTTITLGPGNASFSCSLVAGLGARIYWETPFGHVPNSAVFENVTLTVTTNKTSLPDYFADYESKLMLEFNTTDSIFGEFKCVLADEGNLLDKQDDLLVEYSFQLVKNESTVTVDSPDGRKSMDMFILLGVLAVAVFVIILGLAMFVALFVHHRRYRIKVAISTKDDNFFKMSMLRKNSLDCGYVLGPKAFVNQLFLLEKEIDKELPRECIKYEGILGQGTFGQVVKARLSYEGVNSTVAIKTVKDNAGSKDVQDMKYELEMMRHIEAHPNVVNLLGYCTISDGPPCIVMEYVAHGNLKAFLHKCSQSLTYRPRIEGSSTSSSCSSGSTLLSHHTSSHGPLSGQESLLSTATMHSYITFPTQSLPDHLPLTPESPVFATPTTPTCEDVALFAIKPECSSAHSIWPIHRDYINVPGVLTDQLVHNFALQIASGLEHLNNMNIIHCDLAARNILVTRDHTLKIADFGMAKDLGEKEYHRKSPRDRIPVKWTAPEALERWIFTHKSDVWSYAVILWEILTYGEMPYKSLANCSSIWDDMVTHLRAGHRLTPPKGSSEVILELMSQCWAWDPQERPSAGNIVETLHNATSLLTSSLDVDKEDSGYIDERDLEKDCPSDEQSCQV